jgi:hypothetical protein
LKWDEGSVESGLEYELDGYLTKWLDVDMSG